ncbi:cathepsin CPC1 [Toxoplasma gondii GAB2-2007-GAL-DOM2]|uniref:Dipeptidyl peptidase 1 n=3 Tax=Toxoplasma gondii TaxID=5811 RepID=A0A086L9L9_TOXGO|nr:cathepsin CPC1 [Toxoplasma gondii GAB2-2007-GAL-DOM2]KFG53337.1 cathepsin CPC1 [Toxoplasma gondii FOU]RQX73737.1 cathepsin CPC1 [Toxoplasma gondii CAST]
MEGMGSLRRRCAALPLVAGFLVFLGSIGVKADLPIHATVHDIKGDWTFYLSPAVPGDVSNCGSPSPNTNTSNLREELKDYKSFLSTQGGIKKELRVSLTDIPVSFATTRTAAALENPHRRTWKTLGVFDGQDKRKLVGSWTTVYDEGFEVDVGGRMRLMGFMKYNPQNNCSIVDGDLENSQGITDCYATDPTRTQIGWYIQQAEDGSRLSGCFYAEKPKAASSTPAAFVAIKETTRVEPASGALIGTDLKDSTSYISQSFVDTHNASPASSWRAGVNSVFANMNRRDLSRFVKDFGFKKMRPAGDSADGLSFMQSSTDISTADGDAASTQVYACPCKKGERSLDTRKLDESEQTLEVLSPVSALEVGHTNFLAAINPHVHESTATNGLDAQGTQAVAKAALSGAGATNTQESLLLPKDFSWSDPFSNQAFDETVTNQGSCGSCYAVAATYALQKRFEIAASRMLGQEIRLFSAVQDEADGALSFLDLGSTSQLGELSAQSILSCSFYNQGCDGGFPYLVGKHARDIGVPQARCMEYQADHTQGCPFQKTASASESQSMLQADANAGACSEHARWYAKDYGYIGGCYECNHCSGEKQIMLEIYNNGPVPVAFDAPPSLFSYRSGVYDANSNHARVCDNDLPHHTGILTGWEYTNHAVTIVGWGETDGENGKPQKYWIVRNTWGPNWGVDGYVKIARGKNLGGIESQATFIDPDFSRGQGLKVAKAIEALKSKTM